MKVLVANRTTFVLRVLNATIVEVAVNKSMPVQVVPVSTTEQIIKIYEVMMQPVIISGTNSRVISMGDICENKGTNTQVICLHGSSNKQT